MQRIKEKKDMKNKKNEKGAIMVEASIYMPLVLCTVMALLYLALFNMQEYMLMYQAQRVAAVVSREEAYLGYEEFGMGNDNEIDFSWGEVPSAGIVTSYYKAYHKNLKGLYRGIGRAFSEGARLDYQSRFANAARQATFIVLGNISSPEIEVDRGFLGTDIKVTITHALPVPGVLKYLGYHRGMTLRVAAYHYSVNPSESVRSVDLAADFISYIMEKLGLDSSYHKFLENTNKVLDTIL